MSRLLISVQPQCSRAWLAESKYGQIQSFDCNSTCSLRGLVVVNRGYKLAVTKALAPRLIKLKRTIVFITSVAGHLNTLYQGIET